MPAGLNEAFKSPFDKVSGQGKESSDDSGTTDIRNPEYMTPTMPLEFTGLSGTEFNPYQQSYQVQSAIPFYNPNSSPVPHYDQPLYQAQAHTSHAPQASQYHDCDRLISDLMSCKVCRQKLVKLMSDIKEEETEQKGGEIPLFPSGLITNIIIGIALIFLMDRIIKLRVT